MPHNQQIKNSMDSLPYKHNISIVIFFLVRALPTILPPSLET